MNKKEIIEKTKKFAEKKFSKDSTGHDWWHTFRVWKTAKKIAREEKADSFIVEMAALLHDVWDWKIIDGETAEKEIDKWFFKSDIDNDDAKHIAEIIQNVSFKGARAKNRITTIEGKIVQDADRLDAIGAIGIARAFSFGGHAGEGIHNPTIKPILNSSEKKYAAPRNTVINHFYAKLLLLKDRMHTRTAREIASRRHAFIKKYLKTFFAEWDGKQ